MRAASTAASRKRARSTSPPRGAATRCKSDLASRLQDDIAATREDHANEVERADELSPFATIDDLITAVEEAVRASVVAFDLPEMAGDARSPARRMNLPC